MIFRIAIWIIFIFGGLISGVLIDINYFPTIWYNIIWHIISFVIGLLVLKLVLIISKNTGRTLAKHGRKGELERLQTNKLVTKGIYDCMRHPMHLGLFFFPMSFAFLSGSITFISIISPIEILLMIIMVFTIEEPEAIRKFGNKYKEYKKTTPAFSFKIKCLKKLLNLNK